MMRTTAKENWLKRDRGLWLRPVEAARLVSRNPEDGFAGFRRMSLALICISLLAIAAEGQAESLPMSADLAAAQTPATPMASLASLLLVPSLDPNDRPPTTDEYLAAAIEQGSQPGLERKNPFRKRSIDLFRSEHDVEILRQDMRLRFRVRPKSRETMSVELRF